MAGWERETYALPGETVYWHVGVHVTRPFYYNPWQPSPDDPVISEIHTIPVYTRVLVVACFPDCKPYEDYRGAIVLVPNNGLWWWSWR